jgi:hypothetical protein
MIGLINSAQQGKSINVRIFLATLTGSKDIPTLEFCIINSYLVGGA